MENEEESAVKENLTTEKKKLKAKMVSLVGKIVGGVVILGGHILKWIGKLPSATSGEICACGFAIMGVFGTIDINMMIDKFVKKESNECA